MENLLRFAWFSKGLIPTWWIPPTIIYIWYLGVGLTNIHDKVDSDVAAHESTFTETTLLHQLISVMQCGKQCGIVDADFSRSHAPCMQFEIFKEPDKQQKWGSGFSADFKVGIYKETLQIGSVDSWQVYIYVVYIVYFYLY